MQANLSLDRTMLAYALHSKQFAMELSNKITYEYFQTQIQWLYKAIMDHFTNPKFKEIPTAAIIEEYLNKHYSQAKFIKEGVALFNEIKEIGIDPAEFTWHLDKFKTRYNDQVQRSCASKMVSLMKNDSGVDEEIEEINKLIKETVVTIDAIHKREAYEEGTLADSAIARAKHYKAVKENPDLAQGVMTGLTELDRITNGLHPGELMLIGGSTGTGKSILMHNIAVNAYVGKHNPLEPAPKTVEEVVGGKNVLYFSLEMPKASQERRIDACLAGVIANEIRDGRLDENDESLHMRALKFQKHYPKVFHIVDMARGVTAREIELKYIEKCEEFDIKFDLVVVDYLGLMSPSGETSKSDWLDLGIISQELHEFARAYGVPVISATQLNRPKDPNKPQHSTDRIARSNMIPDNANVILQIACRGDDEHTRLDMPIYITKMRDGEKGSLTLTKDFARMKVIDLVDITFADGDDDDIGI